MGVEVARLAGGWEGAARAAWGWEGEVMVRVGEEREGGGSEGSVVEARAAWGWEGAARAAWGCAEEEMEAWWRGAWEPAALGRGEGMGCIVGSKARQQMSTRIRKFQHY